MFCGLLYFLRLFWRDCIKFLVGFFLLYINSVVVNFFFVYFWLFFYGKFLEVEFVRLKVMNIIKVFDFYFRRKYYLLLEEIEKVFVFVN